RLGQEVQVLLWAGGERLMGVQGPGRISLAFFVFLGCGSGLRIVPARTNSGRNALSRADSWTCFDRQKI
ncbi:MAG: hypothetical protein DIU55_008930, partial [Bacillota bacterium]